VHERPPLGGVSRKLSAQRWQRVESSACNKGPGLSVFPSSFWPSSKYLLSSLVPVASVHLFHYLHLHLHLHLHPNHPSTSPSTSTCDRTFVSTSAHDDHPWCSAIPLAAAVSISPQPKEYEPRCTVLRIERRSSLRSARAQRSRSVNARPSSRL